MPRHETRARRRSPEQDEEEWQELKDLAKEYGTVHFRSADTIKPYHETGYIFIAGRQNAEQAFNQFSQRGWRGQSIVVTLNGPVDRAKMQSKGSDGPKIVVGPVRSPGFDARASQRRQQPDWNILHAAAMANCMQQGTPSIAPVSTAPQRSPTTPIHAMAPVATPAAYRTLAAYVAPTENPRHAPPPPHMPATMLHTDARVNGTHSSIRHAASITTLQISHAATHHATPVTQSTVAGNSAAPEPAWRSVRVQNLDPEFRKINVQRLFERFGTIEACRIQQERDGRGRVKSLTAFASYSEAICAARALVALNGKTVSGRRLSVTFDGRADRSREQQLIGRLAVATGSARDASRPRRGRYGEEDEQRHRERGQSTKGPLVVNGAPGSGRRRRDAESEESGTSSNDQSDSDASDDEGQTRSRGSGGGCSLEHRMDDMTRMARGVRA